MKVAYIIPARDKAGHIQRTVASVLRQTYHPMEILLSDQGSIDDTLPLMREMAQRYNGPNTVRVLQCPDTECRGMTGLNAHLDWLHTQTDADIVLVTAADDLAHPHRTDKVVAAFKETNASFVGVAMQFIEPGQRPYWEYPVGSEVAIVKTAHPKDSGWVRPGQNLLMKTGGSCALAWSRDLYEKYGPLKGPLIQDMALPFWAGLERGFWFISEVLHAYINHADANNTGLEGVRRAADDTEKKRIDELVHYQMTSTLAHIGVKADELFPDGFPDGDRSVLLGELFKYTLGWVRCRDILTAARIDPKPLKA